MKMIDFDLVPRNLKRILNEKGFTQKQFAKKTGYSEITMGFYCRGEVSPKATTLQEFAEVLGIDVIEFFKKG